VSAHAQQDHDQRGDASPTLLIALASRRSGLAQVAPFQRTIASRIAPRASRRQGSMARTTLNRIAEDWRRGPLKPTECRRRQRRDAWERTVGFRDPRSHLDHPPSSRSSPRRRGATSGPRIGEIVRYRLDPDRETHVSSGW
jgi:hypothetical protein